MSVRMATAGVPLGSLEAAVAGNPGYRGHARKSDRRLRFVRRRIENPESDRCACRHRGRAVANDGERVSQVGRIRQGLATSRAWAGGIVVVVLVLRVVAKVLDDAETQPRNCNACGDPFDCVGPSVSVRGPLPRHARQVRSGRRLRAFVNVQWRGSRRSGDCRQRCNGGGRLCRGSVARLPGSRGLAIGNVLVHVGLVIGGQMRGLTQVFLESLRRFDVADVIQESRASAAIGSELRLPAYDEKMRSLGLSENFPCIT